MSQTFDENGNLLTQTDAAGTTTYTWDARNRLTALSGPTVSASFTYDAFGRRSAKTINGESSTYLYDGADALLERGPGGDAAYLRTLAIDEALSRTDGSGTFAYLADTLGNTVALADAGGGLATTYTYAPFGETAVSGTPANPFQFTGRESDGTGLYYYRARYYESKTSRFLSEDPVRFLAGIDLYGYTDSVGKPLETNLYSYAVNNPLTFIDPLGLWGFSTGFEGAGAAFGFGAFGGLYGNFAHDSGQPWYRGWSSSVTVTLGSGAAASAWGAAAGVHFGGNTTCNVKQLEKGFLNAGRLGLGVLAVEGYMSPDRSVTGGGLSVGPAVGYIGAMAGGSWTWSLGGGQW